MPTVAAMHAAFGDELVSIVRDQLVLDVDPQPYEFTGKKMAILLFSARSGSTFATQLLSAHTGFRRVTDWFLPSRLEELRTKMGLATDHAVAQKILTGQTRGAFASKCIRESIIAAAILGILEQFRDHISFFIIDRRDKVAQAVSFHKARMSGRFHSSEIQQRTVCDADFDFDAIHRHYQRFILINEQFTTLLEALGHPVRRFWYEDFAAEPSLFVRAVNEAMGFPDGTGIKAEARVQKLGDDINARWADRFRETLAARA